MPEELIGALAFLVEGATFFCLQEPDTVAKLGAVGKYIVALFTGWAALMSVLALILVFLPSTFPDKYRWSIWLAAALCFVVANFMVWNRERKLATDATSRLAELETTKPHIVLREPNGIYFEYVWHRFTGPNGNIIREQHVPYLKVRFTNNPEHPSPMSEAEGIRAFIDFYALPDNCLLFQMDGRWSETDQPPVLSPFSSTAPLLGTSFGIGESKSVDIAYRDSSGEYYGWNNDNYSNFNNFYVTPKHLLNGEEFRVDVRLRGKYVDSRITFKFRKKDNAFEIERNVRLDS